MCSPATRSRKRLRLNQLESRDAPASLSGRVFLDYDNSGTFNGPDVGISGATVALNAGPLTVPRTTQTDTRGTFSFSNLPAGTYTIATGTPVHSATIPGKVTPGT